MKTPPPPSMGGLTPCTVSWVRGGPWPHTGAGEAGSLPPRGFSVPRASQFAVGISAPDQERRKKEQVYEGSCVSGVGIRLTVFQPSRTGTGHGASLCQGPLWPSPESEQAGESLRDTANLGERAWTYSRSRKVFSKLCR